MNSIYSILKENWGYDSFRPLQEEIINTVLSGKDCLALLPTGGGKSMCFQVPALAGPGLCLVISPLIALMKDQVENLRKKGITAFSIYSGLSRREVMQTLEVAGRSNCKFLYVSPERLETRVFREYLLSLGVGLIAVDEAHCISQWGYDFRPSYLRIAALREELPDVPVLALTASATPEVQRDICEKLLFKEQNVFRQSFERPNLSYSAFHVESKINRITEILQKVNGTAIVYCRSRKRTKEISNLLVRKGLTADYYHAGLTSEERNIKQDSWLKDETRVIVCTNAFGMGIDKPAVRVVIHADLPDCLENYYQEAGRAGRDGKRSYAVLLYNDHEKESLRESAEIRFPSVQRIREIYQALMNYLQIPSGCGEGTYYAFDLAMFLKNFKKENIPVMATLKTLEQEELLYFNEQVYVPAKLQVMGDSRSLREFENLYPALDPVLKNILRTYEGVIDHLVPINEKQLASIGRSPVEKIIAQLIELQKLGIIRYEPQKEKPQVYLIKNRVKAEDLQIDHERYLARKRQFEERIGAMLGYVDEKKCRSEIIGNYFGDGKMKQCNICDNCLNVKKKLLSAAAFDDIHLQIIDVVSQGPLSMPELLKRINGSDKEVAREVLRYLQQEQKISVSELGMISAR